MCRKMILDRKIVKMGKRKPPPGERERSLLPSHQNSACPRKEHAEDGTLCSAPQASDAIAALPARDPRRLTIGIDLRPQRVEPFLLGVIAIFHGLLELRFQLIE